MKDDFQNFLDNKNCFKLILGANNQDCNSVINLIKIYYEAGCKFFDISADSDIFNNIPSNIKNNAFICMSIGTTDDIHFSKCAINKFKCQKCGKCRKVCIQNAINDCFEILEKKCIGCQKCFSVCSNNAIEIYKKQSEWDFELLKKADVIEFHISSNNKEEIFSKWQKLIDNYKNHISICINRKYFSDVELIETLKFLINQRKEKIIIQADGNPMSGCNNDMLSNLQCLACADIIRKNFDNIPIFLSGGTNFLTGKLIKEFNIDVTGVSMGSFARKLILDNKTEKENILSAKTVLESVNYV